MAQSASLSNEEKYLQVVNKESGNLSKDSLLNVADASVIDSILFRKVSPLFYKTRVHLFFSLSGDFEKNFGLIRGLIEFHRPKHLSFGYNLSQRNIETDVEISQLAELQAFLHDVSIWLRQEIEFRDTLKIILEFENRYKVAKADVYALLRK